MRFLALATLWLLVAPCAAQGQDYREVTERWLETGKRPVGYTPRMLMTAALRQIEHEELAVVGARHSDDPAQADAVRQRAAQLLLRSLRGSAFGDWEPEAQEVVARAVAHATTEPKLTEALRGQAIAATAALTGRDERRMWLLEGKVRLQSFLDPKLARLRPSEHVLEGMLGYYAGLGGDARAAFGLLFELFEKDALPAPRRARLHKALMQIALESDEDAAHQLFSLHCKHLTEQRPKKVSSLLLASERLVTAHRGVLARPEARVYLPQMMAAIVRRIDEGYDSARDAALLKWCRDLRAFVDRIEDEQARTELVKSVRVVVEPMAKSDFDTVQVLASYWL